MSLILPNAPQFSRYESNAAATPSTTNVGTTVNHGGVAHTKTASWTQLIAASAFDAQLVIVTVSNCSSTGANSAALVDIGIGAAAAETAIIPDLMAGFTGNTGNNGGRHYIFPLRVPSGSRISARTQSVLTTGGVDVFVELFGGQRHPDGWWAGSHVTAYGHNAATSAGTVFTPGNSGAEGTGVSMGATTADHKALVLGVQGHSTDTTWGSLAYHFDVGIDAASTEWFESDRFFGRSLTSEVLTTPGVVWWPIYRPIPSGTTVMVRGECSGTADILSAAVYGVS
jgi:hypothetical protein